MRIFLFFLMLSSAFLFGCKREGKATMSEPYPDERYAALFDLNGGGFTGGDGTYSVPLPDGRIVWIFGDTFLGTVNPDSTRERMEPMFMRNSFVVQDGEKMVTILQKVDGQDASQIIPPEVLNSGGKITQDSVWYWPGDGFVEDGQLKVFVSKFTQYDTGSWSFVWKGTAIASFSLPDLSQQDITEFPMEKLDSIHFGHAVLEDKDYTYIYGLKQGKPHLARARAGAITSDWEYFAGNAQWSTEASEARPVADIDGSEQFSVVRRGDQVALVTQLGGFSKEVWSFRSDQPWGPWDSGVHLFSTPIPFENPNVYTYNAVVHPHLEENGELLMSYNLNSFRLQDHFDNALIYRPRFYRVHTSHLFN